MSHTGFDMTNKYSATSFVPIRPYCVPLPIGGTRDRYIARQYSTPKTHSKQTFAVSLCPHMSKTYGYRSLLFTLMVAAVLCAAMWWWMGGAGLFFALCFALFSNVSLFDVKRIKLDDDKLHVVSMLRPAKYDCLFWVVDTANMYIDEQEQMGSKYDTPIVVELKSGEQRIISLPAMLWFERRALGKHMATVMANAPYSDDNIYHIRPKTVTDLTTTKKPPRG